MNILMYFLGTGSTFKRAGATLYNSKYSNIGLKKDYFWYKYAYFFDGPNLFNTGKRSTENTLEQAKDAMISAIDNHLKDLKDNDILYINVRDHSRGGITSTSFSNELLKKYGSNKKINILRDASDSYFGLLAKGENALLRTERSDEEKEKRKIEKRLLNEENVSVKEINNLNNLSRKVYAIKTLFRCTPQQVVNDDIVIIANVGHNDSRFVFDSNPPKTPGLFIAEKQGKRNFKYTAITKSNIQVYFDFISKYCKITQTNRWRLFTNILMQKFGIKSYDKLEELVKIPKSMLFPNLKKEFDDALNSIKKSANLASAFKTATKLFSAGGTFSGLGGTTFKNHLSAAQNYVCDKKNNDYDQAKQELEAITNKTGRSKNSIKSMTAQALIDRINKWYKLN